uniref:Uncharacterized protein n=1 Tax=Cucumis melo TaxID=3656 RepID=A0A9I9DBX1_CUCME
MTTGWRRKKASLEAKEGVVGSERRHVGGGRRRRAEEDVVRKKAFLRMVRRKKGENRGEYIGEGENHAD